MSLKKNTLKNPKTIVITGGPGTGKTSVINHLKQQGFLCYNEISRAITLEARENGIEQLFLEQPLLFSEKLLEGRTQQYRDANKVQADAVFLDRGIPDVLAYMDYIGDNYPEYFIEHCQDNIYDVVFLLPPWEAIFESDNERYENFEQASQIHQYLKSTYERFGYQLVEMPFGAVEERYEFIINTLEL